MNFQTKIGSGGFGSVYKGQLPDNSEVAVKMIEGAGVHGRKEFCTEIAVIGNIHHVNLVRLRGYCAQGPHRLLVYEYMNLGSLDRSLFRPTGKTLDWSERMNIAIGAARGIAYLHSGCQPKILHCDIKPENILLNDEGQVKIADFGLAKLLTPEQTGLFTTMRGTRGYLAPEWLANTLISDRTDVYSFGMVLLELVRGRKNRSEHMNDGESKCSVTTSGSYTGYKYFPLVALQMHEKRCYEDLADPRLEGKLDASEIETGTIQVWEPRVESLEFLRLYGRGVLGGSSNGGTFDVVDEFMMNKVLVINHLIMRNNFFTASLEYEGQEGGFSSLFVILLLFILTKKSPLPVVFWLDDVLYNIASYVLTDLTRSGTKGLKYCLDSCHNPHLLTLTISDFLSPWPTPQKLKFSQELDV
ncbi:putative D-mannose binding lectin receptor-like protein kinase family protein [Carex littledalei]|uniref:Putative D-mannose binding lectin receptor-like protein kinase family protein n=1 Tax=Carex littledalei TaxID=544730 RepID=A0A833QI04_9POAL|nr:putative D-mannose binding lectin receptor-like protein kinase family protein [Carex littledalei]